MSVVHNERKFFVQDPLQPTKTVQTEQGELAFGPNTECMIVNSEATAAEIKARLPWALVSEFENPAFRPAAARGRASFLMPALPFETEYDRRRKEKHETD